MLTVSTVLRQHGYFLDCDLDRGDAGFFTASKAEYELLDPQQRFLLEVVYEALQDAGETQFRGKDIGVYAGVYGEDWHDLHSIDLQETGMYRITGVSDFVLGNRVSYEYGLQGPRCVHRMTRLIDLG
jgi:acyl transferase domain-containing protein